jgi:Protein of unknown function (DUF3093)
MRNYSERLRAPASWWLLGLLVAAIFASTVWAGLNALAALASYVVIMGGAVAGLLAYGGVRIAVTGSQLRAGKAVLSLSAVGQVTPLDRAQTHALRGPQADPAAFLLIRPYLPRAVHVEVAARAGAAGPAGAPYWLIATRNPAGLAAAIEAACLAVRSGGSAVA